MLIVLNVVQIVFQKVMRIEQKEQVNIKIELKGHFVVLQN